MAQNRKDFGQLRGTSRAALHLLQWCHFGQRFWVEPSEFARERTTCGKLSSPHCLLRHLWRQVPLPLVVPVLRIAGLWTPERAKNVLGPLAFWWGNEGIPNPQAGFSKILLPIPTMPHVHDSFSPAYLNGQRNHPDQSVTLNEGH